MGEVIGGILPVALGVAISPVPVIAVILMLLGPRASATGPAFLFGWVVGIAVVVTVVVLVVDPVASGSASDPSLWVSLLKMMLGALAVLLAVRQWRERPAQGREATLPPWMSAVDRMTPLRAVGLAALLAGVNPKNLTLCLAAGVNIATGGLSRVGSAVAVAVFVVLASVTVAVPVLGYVGARNRMSGPLDRLRDWLTENNAVVMSVLLLVIGVAIFGGGLAGL